MTRQRKYRASGFLPCSPKSLEGSQSMAWWTQQEGASVVCFGASPIATWWDECSAEWHCSSIEIGWITRNSTQSLEKSVWIFGYTPISYSISEIQGTGFAHWQWYGGKCLQMAYPAAIQGSWDAMEWRRIQSSVASEARMGQREIRGIIRVGGLPQLINAPQLLLRLHLWSWSLRKYWVGSSKRTTTNDLSFLALPFHQMSVFEIKESYQW